MASEKFHELFLIVALFVVTLLVSDVLNQAPALNALGYAGLSLRDRWPLV